MPYQHKQSRSKQQHHHHHNSEQGVVLVLALFIVTLVAALAYHMMSRQERDTFRTSLIINNVAQEMTAKGSVAWAVIQLIENWEQQKPNQLVDRMPVRSPTDTVNGYQVYSIINDMQARFNLNNLIDVKMQDSFKLLLKAVAPDLSLDDATKLTNNIVNWINPAAAQSDLDKYYAGLSPPYRSAHALMTMSSELQLVKDVSLKLYQALQPYIIALPQMTKINVETAEIPVLMSLSPTITAEKAGEIVSARNQTPLVSTDAFANLDFVKDANIAATMITTTSNYFLVETHVQKGEQDLVVYTLLVRKTNEKKAIVNIVWESKGIW